MTPKRKPWTEARVKYVVHRLTLLYGSLGDQPETMSYLNGKCGQLEAYAHEISHLLALGWSLRDIQRACKIEPVDDVVAKHVNNMCKAHQNDKNEVLTVAITYKGLEPFIDPGDWDAAYRWANGSMTEKFSKPKQRDRWLAQNADVVQYGVRTLRGHLRALSHGFDAKGLKE